MIGVQFNGTDAQDGIDIQSLISNPLDKLPGAANPNSAGNAAQLWYWDPHGTDKYVQLFLSNSTSGGRYGKWCLTKVPTDTSWGTARNGICPKRLTSGMGLWLILPQSTYEKGSIDLTMCGQVVVAESGRQVTLRGDGGYTMVSGGFSTGFALNPVEAGVGEEIKWIDDKKLIGAANPNSAGNADQIWYWDPTDPSNKYVNLYLCNNGTRKNRWCLSKVPTDTSWGTARNQIVSKVIPAGRGFWMIRPVGAPNLTFTLDQPYTLK